MHLLLSKGYLIKKYGGGAERIWKYVVGGYKKQT